MPETLYSVSQVSELTHIPVETIYAWERRYKAIVPGRTGSGRRVYTSKQLARLKLLKECIQKGSRVGTIAHLSDASLHELLQSPRGRSLDRDELVRYANSLEHDEVENRLGVAFMSLGAAGFADTLLAPLLAEVANQSSDEMQANATEHMVTASASSIMFTALRLSRVGGNRSTALFATPEGETHDVGLLASALVAQSGGIRPFYLGAQMPPAALAAAAAKVNADLIILSSTILEPENLVQQLSVLRNESPSDVRILCGGHGFGAIAADLLHGTEYFESVSDFEQMLRTGRLS